MIIVSIFRADGDIKHDQDSKNDQTCYPNKSHDPRLTKTSPKSPEIIEQSIQFSSESSSASMEYSIKQNSKSVTKDSNDASEEICEEVTCDTSLLNKPRTKKTGTSLMAVSQNESNVLRRKSKCQSTASSILRNLTTCCAVDTLDSVTVSTHHRIKKSSQDEPCSEIRNGEVSLALSNQCEQLQER